MSQGWRTTPLPGNWSTIRRQRFTIDGWTCVDCGLHDPTGRQLEADHVGDPGDHRVEMLRTRCRTCHRARTLRQLAENRRRRAALRHRPQPPHPGLTQTD